MPKPALPEWEDVLSAAARLQEILPEAVLVGGTGAALHVGHRISVDGDHVPTDLRSHFDEVLAQLESVAGWKTARVQRPVQILGSLDGIDTGVRQLLRTEPLETTEIELQGQRIRVPTEPEMLRIKGVLILKRNSTRDYLDFVAIADHLGDERSADALRSFDRLYPQASGESALHQLHVQLATPLPFDLSKTKLPEYKHLAVRWQKWEAVTDRAAKLARTLFDKLAVAPPGRAPQRPPRGRGGPGL
jgi:hypothetical protein